MCYQMFHDTPTTQTLTPEPKVKLMSYSGNIIPCLGSIQLGVRKPKAGQCQYEKFYVVDVDSPGVLGLPSLKKLDLINIKIDIISATKTHEPTSKRLQHLITSVDQLKAAYPNQFDRIGNFREPARLHV